MAYKNQFPLKTIYILTKYIKFQDVTLKTEVQIKYKQYKNILSNLLKVKDSILQIIFKITLMPWKVHGKV